MLPSAKKGSGRMCYDILIVGGGPAGLSAAINGRARGKTVLLLSSPREDSPLWKAERVENYLGLPGVTGAELLTAFHRHAEASGAEIWELRALSAMPAGDHGYLSGEDQVFEGRALVLAAGAVRGKPLPGEERLLGRGVSYCATCDAPFYRDKTVAVVGYSEHSREEASFLAETTKEVLYFPAVPHEVQAGPKVRILKDKPAAILGGTQVTALEGRSGAVYPVDGVFILRDAVAPDQLVPGIALEGSHVAVNSRMETNLPGLFACGDITGTPYQYIKAAGQGNVAALSAVSYLTGKRKEEML